MTKRKRYTDEFRASAVVMLESQGYPDKPGALSSVAKYLKVSDRTLQRWFKGESNPPPDNLVVRKKGELADKFEQIAHAYADHLLDKETIGETTASQAAIVAGTAVDKMRLLRGLPTEIVQLMPDVIAAIQSMNQDPVEIFQRIIERAAVQNGDG